MGHSLYTVTLGPLKQHLQNEFWFPYQPACPPGLCDSERGPPVLVKPKTWEFPTWRLPLLTLTPTSQHPSSGEPTS